MPVIVHEESPSVWYEGRVFVPPSLVLFMLPPATVAYRLCWLFRGRIGSHDKGPVGCGFRKDIDRIVEMLPFTCCVLAFERQAMHHQVRV